MKKSLAIVLFILFIIPVSQAQLQLGFKAGMGFNKFLGPLEESESYSFANGIHFGITFNYHFTDIFSLRGELLYVQNGTKSSFNGPSYYIFRIDGERYPAMDNIAIETDITIAYISIPIMASFKPLKKFEFYGGMYINFRINSIGSGTFNFGDRFRHNMDMNYSSDEAGEYKSFPGSRLIEVTILDEKRFLLPILGAYTFIEEKDQNLFKKIDFGLTAGVSYFLNPGFYLGLRFEYGLNDITNNNMDRSLTEVEEDGTLIFRNDSDNPFGYQVSLGFKF